MNNIYYEQGTDHRLQLIEQRGAGMGVFQDLDAQYHTLVICSLTAVNNQPSPRKRGLIEIHF